MDGNFTEWGNWSNCFLPCGNGTRYRVRSCTNPPPAHGGRNCSGPINETQSCNNHSCPGMYAFCGSCPFITELFYIYRVLCYIANFHFQSVLLKTKSDFSGEQIDVYPTLLSRVLLPNFLSSWDMLAISACHFRVYFLVAFS